MLYLNPAVVVELIKIWIILISMEFSWSQTQNVDSAVEFCYRDFKGQKPQLE